MHDEDDYPRDDDGLPGMAMCIALIISMPLWLPLAVLLGLICELIGRRRP